MSKWTGVTEFGDETMTNATRLRIFPWLGAHSWLELIERGIHQFSEPGIVVALSRVIHESAVFKLRMTSPG